MSLLIDGATVCDRCGAEAATSHLAGDLFVPAPERHHAADSTEDPLSETVVDSAPVVEPVPVAEPAPAAPASRGLRELLVVVAGIVGTGALIFAVLMFRSGAAPEAATAEPRAATARPIARTTAETPAVPAEPAARWTSENSHPWVANTKTGVAFELSADRRVSAWMRTVQPLLVVRCTPGAVELFVYTNTPAKIEPGTEDHTVTFSLDDGAATTERWQDSSEHDGLFSPNGSALVQRLTRATRMRFEFTPHNAAPAGVVFNVAGLHDALTTAGKKCRIR